MQIFGEILTAKRICLNGASEAARHTHGYSSKPRCPPGARPKAEALHQITHTSNGSEFSFWRVVFFFVAAVDVVSAVAGVVLLVEVVVDCGDSGMVVSVSAYSRCSGTSD